MYGAPDSAFLRAEVFGMVDILAPPAKELWGNTVGRGGGGGGGGGKGGGCPAFGGGDGISIVIMASIQPPHSDNTQYQSTGFTFCYKETHTPTPIY